MSKMKNENLRSAIVLCGGESRRMGEDKGSLIINQKPMILHILETLNNQIDEAILVLNDEERIAKYKKIIQNNFNKDFNNELSYKMIFLEDEIKDLGPLSGIMTGLNNISSDYALVLPCDSPFINDEFINSMFDCLNNFISKNSIKNNFKNFKNSHSKDFNFIDAIVPYQKKDSSGDIVFHQNNNDNNNFFLNNHYNNNFFLNNEDDEKKNFLLNNCEPLHSIYRKDNSKKIQKLLNSNIRDVKSFLKCINSYFILNVHENNFKNINSKEDI